MELEDLFFGMIRAFPPSIGGSAGYKSEAPLITKLSR